MQMMTRENVVNVTCSDSWFEPLTDKDSSMFASFYYAELEEVINVPRSFRLNYSYKIKENTLLRCMTT